MFTMLQAKTPTARAALCKLAWLYFSASPPSSPPDIPPCPTTLPPKPSCRQVDTVTHQALPLLSCCSEHPFLAISSPTRRISAAFFKAKVTFLLKSSLTLWAELIAPCSRPTRH